MKRAVFTREDGVSYVLTDEDIVWLAKSLEGEGGTSRDKASAVAWTMMNRFMLQKGQKAFGTWKTFKILIRAFSQPVNPGWLLGGKFCPTTNDGNCSQTLTDRRARIQGSSWDQINKAARMYAVAFAAGELPQLAGPFVDFSSNAAGRKYGSFEIHGEFFLTKEDTIRAHEDGAGLLYQWLPGKVVVSGSSEEELPESSFPVWAGPTYSTGAKAALFFTVLVGLYGLYRLVRGPR